MKKWFVTKKQYGSNNPKSYLDILSVKKSFKDYPDLNGSLKYGR